MAALNSLVLVARTFSIPGGDFPRENQLRNARATITFALDFRLVYLNLKNLARAVLKSTRGRVHVGFWSSRWAAGIVNGSFWSFPVRVGWLGFAGRQKLV